MKGGSIFLKVMLVLVFLALVANLVVSAVTDKSVLSEELVQKLAFFALGVANLCLAGAGIHFTWKTQQKREKSTLSWGLRGFVAHAIVTLIFLAAPWFFWGDPTYAMQDRMKDIAYVLLLVGIPNAVFVYAFHREYVRHAGSKPRRTPVMHTSK